jgi:hypothetical protein
VKKEVQSAEYRVQSKMQVNLRRRGLILGVVVILILLLILFVFDLLVIMDPPAAFDSSYDLTATWIKEQNEMVEGFIHQTQSAMTQTPVR